MTFACLDDYSATAAQMQTTVDPYPAGAVSLATTGQGEIERLRYISLHVFGATQWYTAPTENINFRHRRVEMHMGAITALQEMYVGAQTWSNAAVRFHGIAFGVADQASHPESVLARLHVGGNTKFMISKLGDVHAATLALHQGGSIANPAIFHQASATTGIWFHTVLQGAALNHMGVSVSGVEVARFHANGFVTPRVMFQHAASGRFVAMQAHALSSANVLWQLPAADGAAGSFLSTRGDGVLEFTTPAGASAWTRAGGTQTGGTTGSTAAADVVIVSGLSIPVDTPFRIGCAIRKSSGFAGSASVGLTINSTAVMVPRAVFDATNEAQSGTAEFQVAALLTDYGRGMLTYGTAGAAGELSGVFPFVTAARPNATVTSITIRGLVANGASTLGANDCQVYQGATAG
mgnify:CR=1 FL=1